MPGHVSPFPRPSQDPELPPMSRMPAEDIFKAWQAARAALLSIGVQRTEEGIIHLRTDEDYLAAEQAVAAIDASVQYDSSHTDV